MTVLLGQDPGLELRRCGKRCHRDVPFGLEADPLGEPLLLPDQVAEQAPLPPGEVLAA